MPMPFSELSARHQRDVRAAACLLLTALLTACTTSNPLMQEPVAAAKPAQPAAAPAPAAPATASAVPPPSLQAPAAKPAAVPAPAQTAAASAPAAAPAPASTPASTPAAASAPTAPASAVPAQAAAPVAADGVQTTQNRRFLGIFSPYRPDVQQGNFVSREMLAQLKEGMTPDQVRFVLGTPLLNDLFHANRWDYVFRMQKGNGEVTTSRVALFFKDNRLSRIDGGNLPDEKEYLSRLAGKAPEAKPSTAPSAVPADAAKSGAPATGAAATK
jgi:outer membrane protein assembly factor BamE